MGVGAAMSLFSRCFAKRNGVRRHAAAVRIVLFAALLAVAGPARAQTIDTIAEQAILIDSATGAVLYHKNADQPFPPASLALLMTVEVVFDALRQGLLSQDREFKISEHAWRTGGAPARRTTMFAKLNSMVPVGDLLRGVIVQIANDGAIALAEGIAGSEKAFAELMTLRALEVGMTNSTFVNPTGYADPAMQTTARDLAILARHLIRTYPKRYRIFAETDFTWNKIFQRNRNPLLATTKFTVDGLMVGGTDKTRLGMVVSARRGRQRLILAFFGLPSKKAREKEAMRLLEWGFDSYENVTLFEAGETVGEARVFGGDSAYVPLIGDGPVVALMQKDIVKGYHGHIVYDGPVPAPIHKRQPIGHLEIRRDKVPVQRIPLFAAGAVGRGGFHRHATDALIEAIAGLWY